MHASPWLSFIFHIPKPSFEYPEYPADARPMHHAISA
jgi:hypothetical protein